MVQIKLRGEGAHLPVLPEEERPDLDALFV
jgi:hypothetical protein